MIFLLRKVNLKMTNDENTSNLEQGFEKISVKLTSQKTEEELLMSGKKVMKALDAAAREAQENGLTEEIGRQILDEYYEEKYGKKGD